MCSVDGFHGKLRRDESPTRTVINKNELLYWDGKKREVDMTPQKQKLPVKVGRANGNEKSALAPANGTNQQFDWASFLAGVSRGKNVSNTAWTVRSLCRETLPIPCGFSSMGR